ncbi:MAG: thioredoxin family protein [Bacteroidota bacterium]
MRTIISCMAIAILCSFTTWGNNFDKALQTAKSEHKYVLLNFSGSDWCGPCIKLHNDFFGTEAFRNFAESRLALVNADFPRQKRNQLSKDLQKQNNHLADLYNANGSFPLTVLLNAEGKVLRAWEGVPKESADEFIDEIKNILAESK